LDIRGIISELEAERDRITRAITALQEVGKPYAIGRQTSSSATGRRPGTSRLSPAARRRISEAAKKRWRKAKAAGKKRL